MVPSSMHTRHLWATLLQLTVLLYGATLAVSKELSYTLTPERGWISMGGGNFAYGLNDASVSFQFDTADYSILQIRAYGYAGFGSPLNVNPSPWYANIDGDTVSFTGQEEQPVNVTYAFTANHVYNVEVKSSTTGLAFFSATGSGSPVPLPNGSPTTTQRPPNQEPSITSTPSVTTAQFITTSSTRLTSTLNLFSSSSPQSASTSLSMQTLGNPYLNAPQNSVSLTNPDAALSTSNSNLATTGQPSYSTIVGAVFGTLAGLGLCILGCFLYYRRRQRKRIPPSMAYMNYRSTTEQPPRWNLHRDRTAFNSPEPVSIQNNRAGVGAGGGSGLLAAGFAAAASAKNGRLSVLDERSAEGSMAAHSPSPYGGRTNDVGTGDERHSSLDSTIDAGIARTISPPSSADPTMQNFPVAETRPVSIGNSTAYDGVEPYGGIEVPVKEQHSNPFEDAARHVV